MILTRRSFVKAAVSLLAATAAPIIPSPVSTPILLSDPEPRRKFWQLDGALWRPPVRKLSPPMTGELSFTLDNDDLLIGNAAEAYQEQLAAYQGTITGEFDADVPEQVVLRGLPGGNKTAIFYIASGGRNGSIPFFSLDNMRFELTTMDGKPLWQDADVERAT